MLPVAAAARNTRIHVPAALFVTEPSASARRRATLRFFRALLETHQDKAAPSPARESGCLPARSGNTPGLLRLLLPRKSLSILRPPRQTAPCSLFPARATSPCNASSECAPDSLESTRPDRSRPQGTCPRPAEASRNAPCSSQEFPWDAGRPATAGTPLHGCDNRFSIPRSRVSPPPSSACQPLPSSHPRPTLRSRTPSPRSGCQESRSSPPRAADSPAPSRSCRCAWKSSAAQDHRGVCVCASLAFPSIRNTERKIPRTGTPSPPPRAASRPHPVSVRRERSTVQSRLESRKPPAAAPAPTAESRTGQERNVAICKEASPHPTAEPA